MERSKDIFSLPLNVTNKLFLLLKKNEAKRSSVV